MNGKCSNVLESEMSDKWCLIIAIKFGRMSLYMYNKEYTNGNIYIL